jgi:glycosidase
MVDTVLLLTQVVVDLVAGHTSDQHEWFEKSVAREAGYEDYYVWRDGASSPPTPWKSVDGGKFLPCVF